MNEELETLLALWLDERLRTGVGPAPESFCGKDQAMARKLRELIADYESVAALLEEPAPAALPEPFLPPDPEELPRFPGFRTIEKIGQGGAGSVYKLEDLALGRVVAGKVLRPDALLRASVEDFLREARALALFDDPRIVRILEFRGEADPPVLIMEYVEGFDLGRLAPSLEFPQRARILAEVAEAIHGAHRLGIQHRDLKPAHIRLDTSLRPRILDFGLSRGEPETGHGLGTLPYVAPEQLDSSLPIDARTDVYALGVILYEILTGTSPFPGTGTREVVQEIREGSPRLPAEIVPDVPEPLQAIALKAMERDPADRYATAREMAQDLHRYLEGRPVLARPTTYRSALDRLVRPHLEQVREWLRLRLIYPHEAAGLESAYRRLEAREDDWILGARFLSLSRITLYLGAFLMVAGSLLYFGAYALQAVKGLAGPLLVLGVPVAGLHLVASHWWRRERRAVAVAFLLGAALLLPILLLMLLRETGMGSPGSRELLDGDFLTNRRLQLAALAGAGWASVLAWRTRTIALATVAVALALLFHLGLMADFGLREWLEAGHWDRVGLALLPLGGVWAGLGFLLERKDRPWFARPLDVGASVLGVLALELVALDGRAMALLGVSLAPLQPGTVSDPHLLDTLTAMTAIGLLVFATGSALDRWGTPILRFTAVGLLAIAPFATLEPLAYLVKVGEFSPRFDWLYLGLGLGTAFASRIQQRRSFYLAGLTNTGVALWFLTDHRHWFDRPVWSAAVVAMGLVLLAAGCALDSRERRLRFPRS